ncbi:hypothetical protein ACFV3E_24795 [Streptomyces sp. NPDC059718]
MTARMALHVALSMRLDATKAHRLANRYRAEVLREVANAFAALGPEDSLVSAPEAWTEAIETLRRMADERGKDTGTQTDESTQPLVVEAYNGELAMLRGLLRLVRVIAEHSNIHELRRVLAEHRADEQAAYAEQPEPMTPLRPRTDDRRQALLTTIRQRGGQWTTGRVRALYKRLYPGHIYRSALRSDLALLHRKGHLTRNDGPRGRYYTLATAEGGTHRA